MYIYIHTYIFNDIYLYPIYGPPGGLQPPPPLLSPANPPSNHPDGGGQPSMTIRQDLMCYTYVLAVYYPYTIYMIPLEHPTHPTVGDGVKYP